MIEILVINTAGLAVGGITTHMKNYLAEIMKTGEFSIDIVATILVDDTVVEDFEIMGCKVFYLPNRKKNLISYQRKLREMMRQKKYNVIHVHGNSATMCIELRLAKKIGIKTRIAHCHNSLCDHRFLHKLLEPYFKNMYTNAIACSKIAGDWIFKDGKYIILKNAIDVKKFEFDDEVRKNYRKLFGIDDNTLFIANVGNFTEQKNQKFLIPIIAEIKKYRKVKLALIGATGFLYSEILQEIEKNSLKDDVLVFKCRNDIAQCLQAFDCLVMPSKWEGLPMILVEAQTSGLPCIVSDCVSDEVKFNEKHFDRLPLEKNLWVEKLKSFKKSTVREKGIEYTKNVGYDLHSSVNILKSIYKVI